jgi:hypothetical protein
MPERSAKGRTGLPPSVVWHVLMVLVAIGWFQNKTEREAAIKHLIQWVSAGHPPVSSAAQFQRNLPSYSLSGLPVSRHECHTTLVLLQVRHCFDHARFCTMSLTTMIQRVGCAGFRTQSYPDGVPKPTTQQSWEGWFRTVASCQNERAAVKTKFPLIVPNGQVTGTRHRSGLEPLSSTAVPAPPINYHYQNAGLTEIYLHFAIPILILMT